VANADLTHLELLFQLEQLSAGLRATTQLTNAVIDQSQILLGGFKSPETVSKARGETISLNEKIRRQLMHSLTLLERSREITRKLHLSPWENSPAAEPPISSMALGKKKSAS